MIARKRLVGKSGQALVEFSLVLPILILVIVGIIEFAILFSSFLVVQNAARDAVRQIAVGGSDVAVFQLVKDSVVGIDSSKLNFSATPAAGVRRRGEPITVTVVYNHHIITPMLSLILGQDLQWQMTATMRYE